MKTSLNKGNTESKTSEEHKTWLLSEQHGFYSREFSKREKKIENKKKKLNVHAFTEYTHQKCNFRMRRPCARSYSFVMDLGIMGAQFEGPEPLFSHISYLGLLQRHGLFSKHTQEIPCFNLTNHIQRYCI